MNTRCSGAWDHYGGHRGHDRRRDDRGSRRRAWEARDDAGRDLPTGVHLDQVRDLSAPDQSVSRSLTGSSTVPFHRGGRCFPADRVDRLQHRSSSSKRRKPSAHERTEHRPPGDVDLPGLWTPAHRRAESGGRRGGRPQAVGNLAGERRRPARRPRDSHSSTTHHITRVRRPRANHGSRRSVQERRTMSDFGRVVPPGPRSRRRSSSAPSRTPVGSGVRAATRNGFGFTTSRTLPSARRFRTGSTI